MDEKRAKHRRDLEAVLARHLGRVVAPEELWHRLQTASYPPVSQATRRIRWAMGFLLSLALLAGCFHLYRSQHSVGGMVAPLRAQMPGNLEFQSPQATKIREWVHHQTGLDIPLCAEPSGKVQLVGARLAKGAVPTAAITYRVNQHEALLLVFKINSPPSNSGKHHVWTEEPKENKQTISWTMQGQSYRLALAVSSDFRDACGVCHSQIEQITALN